MATVSAQGLVTAVMNGTATITASVGSVSQSAMVTVSQTVDSVAVEPAMVTLTAIGETVQLVVTALDRNEHPVKDASVIWRSGDAGIATVSDQGLVTAVMKGTATITASVGSVSQSAMITVSQTVDSVAVEPAMVTLTAIGETVQLVATSRDRNGHPVKDASVTWRSSDEGIATVSDQGLVTAVMKGTATITASVGSVSQNAIITVVDLTLSRDALSMLYFATGGPRWKNNEHWLGDRPFGEWHGVTTDSTGHVTMLALQENDLNGTIPPELGNLGSLQTLWLDGNELSGGIPAELGSLSNLVRISLHGNQLSGGIPGELGRLGNLERLFLSNNRLEGSIPPELGQLVSLEYLSLGGNRLSGGIPSELGGLVRLRYLWLNGNSSLSGPLPLSFTGLVALERLYASDTGLCAPNDDAFLAWLMQIPIKSGIFSCGTE